MPPNMRPQILLHPQLRMSLPRTARRELSSRLFSRITSSPSPFRPFRKDLPSLNPLKNNKVSYYHPPPTSNAHGKKTLGRGPPERVLVYHAGNFKIYYLVTMRYAALFVILGACAFVAPNVSKEYDWYVPVAVVLGSAIPMLFISYVAAPFVNFVHVKIPLAHRKTPQQIIAYVKNLPPSATVYINTMKVSMSSNLQACRLDELQPASARFRAVNFQRVKPGSQKVEPFFTGLESAPVPQTRATYTELWKDVYGQIQKPVSHRVRSIEE